MQVVVMAAGLGSRLGAMTAATPKALIEVGGRPLIDYALAFAARAGGARRVVVTGFCHADVATRVRAVDPDAVIVENTEFRKGNLLSMQRGQSALEPGPFLLMNTDHVYRPAIADVVARACASATEITAFCDFDRTLGPDDMKVGLDADRRVARMAKTLPTWDCGYVGMTFVPAARRDAYRAAADETRAALGETTHAEAVLVRLAEAGTPPAIADISGHGWLEIDEPAERAHADAVLAAERWYPAPSVSEERR
jgi:choline kinase